MESSEPEQHDSKPPSGGFGLSRFTSFERKGKGKRDNSVSRGRSRQVEGDDDNRDDDGEKKGRGFFRGRSSSRQRGRSGERGGRSKSRGPLRSLRRSLSRSRKKDESAEDTKRGRGRKRNSKKLPPPLPPGGYEAKPEEEKKESEEADPEVDAAIDKLLAEHRQLTDMEKRQRVQQPKPIPTIESLGDDDVMQLDRKNTSMHVACLLHHSPSAIFDRLENEPYLARCNNNAYETPLHYAVMDKQGVDKEVLKELIHLNPEAVKQPNVQNSLPIHLACMAGAPSTYVIKTLLKLYPRATMMQSDIHVLYEVDSAKDSGDDEDSDDGSQFEPYTPKNTNGVSAISRLFVSDQAAIDMAKERAKLRKKGSDDEEDELEMETGFTPLHLAVMNKASKSVIEMLLKVNRHAIYVKTSRGRTALDCAQSIIKNHWLYGTDNDNLTQKTFDAIECLEEAAAGR